MMAIWFVWWVMDLFRGSNRRFSDRANAFVVTARNLRPTIIGFVEKAAYFGCVFFG